MEGHQVPRSGAGPRAKGPGRLSNAVWNLRATRPNQIWSYDFLLTRTDDGLAVRIT